MGFDIRKNTLIVNGTHGLPFTYLVNIWFYSGTDLVQNWSHNGLCFDQHWFLYGPHMVHIFIFIYDSNAGKTTSNLLNV